MAFDAPEAYDRFMGRYSDPLGARFVELVALEKGDRALDVGCGPGTLTRRLVERLGAESVAAADPSPAFVEAVQARCPAVDVRCAGAEQLPFADSTFDVALAQLVVPFMTDPLAGLTEMRRVVKPGGLVAASVWDHAGGGSPLALFWKAVKDVDPKARTESAQAGAGRGQLGDLCHAAGLTEVRESLLTVTATCDSFQDWWEPYTLGVGPAGEYVVGLDDQALSVLRNHCSELLPKAPFDISAAAWVVVAAVPQF